MKKIAALIAVFGVVFAGVCTADEWESVGLQDPTKVVLPALTGEQFLALEAAKPAAAARTGEEALEGDSIYVMLVGFKGCGFCQNAENAVIKPLFKQYVQQKYIKVVKVDKDEDAQKTQEQSHRITELFNVEKFPTILIVHDKKEQWRYVGFDILKVKQIKDAITTKVQEIVNTMKANYATKRS